MVETETLSASSGMGYKSARVLHPNIHQHFAMKSSGLALLLLAGFLTLWTVMPSASAQGRPGKWPDQYGERPGKCPTPPPDTHTICIVKCDTDWECPAPQKCCNWGCMRDCFDPVKN
ncbi:omwaprin-b-like [Eublepharis macularius]|uniref:Omwaprin-b-like n=1 Tax=Eublepharis macularius TaxID=481883 RepID=A0AA97L192_EUBMA|nr:omwaprin-b-like [Eublepharis macularius]